MVYMEPVHLGWKCMVESWEENFCGYSEKLAKMIAPVVMDMIEEILPYMREECSVRISLGQELLPYMREEFVVGILKRRCHARGCRY
jgi:hypothetical protein